MRLVRWLSRLFYRSKYEEEGSIEYMDAYAKGFENKNI